MTEADILAKTYTDTCSVYRPTKKRLPSGESVFADGLEGERVYTDIPCALSSPSGGKLQRSSTVADTATDYALFVRPDVDILPGDLVIVRRCGQTTAALAGQPSRHPSHNNIPLMLKPGVA